MDDATSQKRERDRDGTGADAPAGLHHVGVATPDATGIAELYGDLLDLPVAHEETFDGMTVVFAGAGPYVELLEPLTDEGPIARHLDRRGRGLHHLAYAVEDVTAALERARERGVDPIDDDPRPGAWGHEVAFLRPEPTGGVLLELVGAGTETGP